MQKPCEPKQLELDYTSKPDIADGMNALDEILCQVYRKDLKCASPRKRRKAVRGLASLPKLAATSIPALEEALNDRDYEVRRAAAAALTTLVPSR
jgi:hypothetical protein